MQIYHVNLLKRWHDPGQAPDPVFVASFVTQDPTPDVPLGDQLTPRQRQELRKLVARNQDVFATTPGHTTLIEHDIITAREAREASEAPALPLRPDGRSSERRSRRCSG